MAIFNSYVKLPEGTSFNPPRNDYDIVSKISIVPRGPAGGVTIFMPSEERLNSGAGSMTSTTKRMVGTCLTGAFYLGNGWVAGGCWDDYY
jgi:hypothetical protein